MSLKRWAGPKVAVSVETYDRVYGLDLMEGTATELGLLPFEVPNMPPFYRERAQLIDGFILPLAGPNHGRPFRVVAKAEYPALVEV